MKAAVIMLLCLPVLAEERPAAKALARECDALVDSLMKKPYGWGVVSDAGNENAPRGAVAVSLEAVDTPAAIVVLQHAGRLLEQPKYIEAAQNMARGLAASQQASGKFPAVAYFGGTVIKGEKPIPLPDRASTRACVAALASVVDGVEKEHEQLTRAATRGASWVARQQVESGAWQSAWPPDAEAKDLKRVYRLDTTATRDDVFTMLVAYQVLGDAMHRRAAEKSIDFLLKARLHESAKVGGGLWNSAFTLAGFELDGIEQFPRDTVDVLASRHAVQTIMAVYVVLGTGNLGAPMDICLQSLRSLPRTEAGTLHRRYTLRGEAWQPPESTEPKERAALTGEFGVTSTTEALATLRENGREKFKARLEGGFPARQRLAQALLKLNDDPLALDWPTGREEAEAYLKRREAQFAPAFGQAGEFQSRAQRVWVLYLKARLERLP